MNRLGRYGKAIWLYLQTDKGKHDSLDYARAAFIIVMVTALVMVMVKKSCGF